METFYIIALSITTIALIFLLSYVGMQMSYYRNDDATYPPVAASCPDFWKSNDDGKCEVPNTISGAGFCGISNDIKVNNTFVYLPTDTAVVNGLVSNLTTNESYPVDQGNTYHTFMNIPLMQTAGKDCTLNVTVKYVADVTSTDDNGNSIATGINGIIDSIEVNTHGTGYIEGNATIAENALGTNDEFELALTTTAPTGDASKYNVNPPQLQLGNIYNTPTDLITAEGTYTVSVNTNGSGTGCKVVVVTDDNTIASVTVSESGSGYKAGDIITIPPNQIGGSTTQTTASFGLFEGKCTDPNGTGDASGGIQNIGSVYNSIGSSNLTTNNTHGYDATSTTIDFSSNDWGVGASAICKKKIWASQYGLVWDGITNYNGC